MYKNKYLKYKSKYLKLKKQMGRGFGEDVVLLDSPRQPPSPFSPTATLDPIVQKLNQYIRPTLGKPKIEPMIAGMIVRLMESDDFKLDKYKDKLYEIKEKLLLSDVSYKGYDKEPFVDAIGKSNVNFEIKDFFNSKKECTIDELMTLPDYAEKCYNLNKVKGSCSHPSFQDSNRDLTLISKDFLLEILSLVERKLSDKKNVYLDLVLGATEFKYSDFEDNKNSVTVLINENHGINNNEILETMKKEENIIGKKYEFDLQFPLSFKYANSMSVLSEIIKLNSSGLDVRITNRICGTCFRSLWYLVGKGIQYKVRPEQSLNDADTVAIRKCFKS